MVTKSDYCIVRSYKFSFDKPNYVFVRMVHEGHRSSTWKTNDKFSFFFNTFLINGNLLNVHAHKSKPFIVIRILLKQWWSLLTVSTGIYKEQLNIGSAQSLDEHLTVMNHNNKSAHLFSPILGCAILKRFLLKSLFKQFNEKIVPSYYIIQTV